MIDLEHAVSAKVQVELEGAQHHARPEREQLEPGDVDVRLEEEALARLPASQKS